MKVDTKRMNEEDKTEFSNYIKWINDISSSVVKRGYIKYVKYYSQNKSN